MNKYKQLVKQIAKQGVVAAIVVGGVGAVYAGVYFFSESVATQKTDAENKYNTENALLTNLRGQMDQSGAAEKRYAEIIAGKDSNADFSMNKEKLGVWFRNAITQFRLSNESSIKFEGNQPETPSTKAELANFSNYTISTRSGYVVKLDAVSDTHVFSVIDSMMHSAPGLIRIDSFEIKRKGEIKDDVINNIRNGVMPLLVSAEIHFTWIGLNPKATKQPTTPGAPGTPQGK